MTTDIRIAWAAAIVAATMLLLPVMLAPIGVAAALTAIIIGARNNAYWPVGIAAGAGIFLVPALAIIVS